MVKRSRDVSAGMSKGVQFLFKKNKIDQIKGFGKLVGKGKVEVTAEDSSKTIYESKHVILATGARSKELPGVMQDGKKIIGYRDAMTLEEQPESMVVIGSGAIGSEFAHFYNTIGTRVTLVEFLSTVIPNEDEEVAKTLGRAFKKNKIKVMVDSSVQSVDITGEKCKVLVKTKKGEQIIEVDVVLSAVGVTPNIEGIGLEEIGVEIDKGKIKVDDFYRTSVEGVYAIGDIVSGPALAHVASAEGITCVEKIAGKNPEPVNYKNIPRCTYTFPEVASVGITEQQATEKGLDIKVGKFPFTASGKASASGSRDGFVKLIFDEKYGELLGAHMIGDNVTEMIAEMVVSRKLEITGEELIKSIHPHPTMSEAIMEAAADAWDEVIHL